MPIFASKHSFFQIFRDPQDFHYFAPLRTQNFNNSFNVLQFSELIKTDLNHFKMNFLGLSGAKVCKSCRSRQELSNEYLLAKIGIDTAENEPLKVWRKIQFIVHSPPYSPETARRSRGCFFHCLQISSNGATTLARKSSVLVRR